MSPPLLYEATSLFRIGSQPYDSFNFNYLLKILSLNTIILGITALIYEFLRDTTQSIANIMSKILLILVCR